MFTQELKVDTTQATDGQFTLSYLGYTSDERNPGTIYIDVMLSSLVKDDVVDSFIQSLYDTEYSNLLENCDIKFLVECLFDFLSFENISEMGVCAALNLPVTLALNDEYHTGDINDYVSYNINDF